MQDGESATTRGEFRGPASGFTLIELLIVIAIIMILASLITVGLRAAKKMAMRAETQQEISSFESGLKLYQLDYNIYPGWNVDPEPEVNAFPELYEALLGKKPPEGGGGKGAPYVEKINLTRVVVRNEYAAEDEPEFEVADKVQRKDKSWQKYYQDPWGDMYIYRENSSKQRKEPWMINESSYDLWSVGPNDQNESEDGLPDPSPPGYDDLGNWGDW